MCKWYKDEFCTNDKCPYCTDYCPVAQNDTICKYRESDIMTATDEEREQQIKRYIGGLPKGTQKDIWDYISSLKERVEDAQAVKLYALNMQNGAIDMSLESEHCKAFMATIIQIFEQNGGKNFFTTTVELDNRKGARYALTIQKTDGQTPAEKLADLQAENNSLKENSIAFFKELRELCDNVFRQYDLTEDEVNKYEKQYGVEAKSE